MAKKADEGQVSAAIRPPDFRGAVARIRSIVAKKTKLASVNGEIADIFAKIEGLKVNKVAARFFGKLDAMEQADRSDIIRSLNGLMDVADWDRNISDLADGGTVINGRFGKAEDGGDGEGEGEDNGVPGEPDEEEQQEEEEPASRGRARRGSGIAGLDAARNHLGGAPA